MSNRTNFTLVLPGRRQSVTKRAAVFLVTAWLFVCANCHPDYQLTADADVVWIQGETEPVYGTVIERTATEIHFRRFGSAADSSRKIPLDSIKTLVVNIDVPRLEALNPENPVAYRDYAEELASQRRDPSARELAVRLYLLGAFLAGQEPDGSELRQSCLNGLVALADSDAQREQWNTLRFLYNPTAPLDDEPEPPAVPLTEDQRQQALAVVRLLRRGNGTEAIRLMEQPETKSALRPWSSIYPLDQLKRLAILNQLTTSQLHRLLQIELAILNREPPTTAIANQRRPWSEYARTPSSIGSMVTSFQSATPFNPEESVFRDGSWIRPN